MSGRSARAKRREARERRAARPTVDGHQLLAGVISDFCDAVDLLLQAGPANGSQAWTDARSWDRSPLDDLSRPGREISLLPARQLAGAVDHLRGAAATLRAPRVLLAPYTLYRAAAESAALAYYLTDPKISTRDRVGRWLNTRVNQRQAVILFLDADSPERVEALARYERCLEQARRADFDVCTTKRTWQPYTPAHIKPAYPKSTTLVDELMAEGYGPGLGRSLYQFTSAIAHGQEQFNSTFMGDAEETGEPGVLQVIRQDRIEIALMGAGMGIGGVQAATQRLIDYYGWPTQEWATAALKAASAMRWLRGEDADES